MQNAEAEGSTAKKTPEELKEILKAAGVPKLFNPVKSGEEGVGMTYWDNLMPFKDKTGAYVDLTESLKQESGSSTEVDGITYSIWNKDGSVMVFARTKDAQGRWLAKRAAGGSGGGRRSGSGGGGSYYSNKKVLDLRQATTNDEVKDLLSTGYQPFGSNFHDSTVTMIVDGVPVVVIGMVKKE